MGQQPSLLGHQIAIDLNFKGILYKNQHPSVKIMLYHVNKAQGMINMNQNVTDRLCCKFHLFV